MEPAIAKPQRCAIYTRKSTEHNLDLEFNSLDAQRERARRMRAGGSSQTAMTTAASPALPSTARPCKISSLTSGSARSI
jgi:hypothetical protein